MRNRSPVSARMQAVQTPVIPLVGEWTAQHPGTISLGQGVVHFSPPPSVAEAVTEALKNDARLHRYGLVRGLDELLEPIATKLQAENDTDLQGRSLIVTAGSNMGFLNAILAIGDVDDEIILLSPYYFNHEMAITIAGCRPVIVETDENNQIDVAKIEASLTDRTRAIVTISPNNPTGAVYSKSELTAVNHLCASRGIYHISDEAYEYFLYDDNQHFSPTSLPSSHDHTIALYSLSKAYGMAGWRIGYMVVPATLETPIKKVQDTNLICPVITSQIAAIGALRAGVAWCQEQIGGFNQVREIVLNRLTQLGDRVDVAPAQGAFYALVRVQSNRSDIELVEALIREHGVAVMPGGTFGVETGCALRIAYGALQADTVAEGMDRVVQGLEKLL